MIKTMDLICSCCGKKFTAEEKLYYRDAFAQNPWETTELICADCIDAWQKKWQLKEAHFTEENYVLTVDIVLADGTEYKNMDCTPIDDTETVVLGEDAPEDFQQDLYKIYDEWRKEEELRVISDCYFAEKDGRMMVTLKTKGGESYTDVAFTQDENGNIITETEMPDYILDQLYVAYLSYKDQELMFNPDPVMQAGISASLKKRPSGRSKGVYGQQQIFETGGFNR